MQLRRLEAARELTNPGKARSDTSYFLPPLRARPIILTGYDVTEFLVFIYEFIYLSI